jgi:hypothetical protein
LASRREKLIFVIDEDFDDRDTSVVKHGASRGFARWR